MSKCALVTGVSGQDGSYLSELLLEKGFEVHGIQRRTSTITTERIDHIMTHTPNKEKINTHYADLSDGNSILNVLLKVKPDIVFNMASMSHVRISFDIPEYTADVTGIGPLRILEGLRSLGMTDTKFYQASSSEMFGSTPPPQNEESIMMPQSPYGASKLMAYHLVKQYRSGYGMFTSNGILFNHESPRRGRNFVTQKICHEAAKIKLGVTNKIRLGNLDAKRDWGFAGDYMECVYLIMQHHEPDDFVVATEHQYTVKEFAEQIFKRLGLDFYDYVEFDPQYLRPNEVPSLLGDSTKARTVLGWKPKVNFEQLVDMMVEQAMIDEEFNLYKSKNGG